MPKRISVLELTNRVLDSFCTVGRVMAQVILVTMFVSVVIGVIARYGFNSPLAFVNEYVPYMMVAVSLLALNWALRQKSHIRVDVAIRLLSPKKQAWLLVFTDIISIVIVAVMLKAFIGLAHLSIVSHTISLTILETPLGLVQLSMPIGIGFLLIELLRTTVISIKSALSFSKSGS